ncbi:hypothetical protein YPPY88_2597, partial [Yersinia pestis PY-88]
MAFFI